MADLTLHSNTESFISDIKRLVEQGRNAAYGAVNAVMIETYWRIGQRIVEQEQKRQRQSGLWRTTDRDAIAGIDPNIRKRFQRQVFACFPLFLSGRSRHRDLEIAISKSDMDAYFQVITRRKRRCHTLVFDREIEQQKELYRLQQENK